MTVSTLVGQQPPGPPVNVPSPAVKEGATLKVSEHVYVIPDGGVVAVANIGMVVGSSASLVMDSGLGPRNGQAVLRELGKVSRNSRIYVAATHFHPEHALGESEFPATATIVRSQAQQQDINEREKELFEFFNSRPAWAEFMAGARYRPADVLFDRELEIDLGGVRVLLVSLGPAHTRGDTGLFVYGDAVVFTGDVAMNTPLGFNANSTYSSAPSKATVWLASLERMAALRPARVVPAHGAMGDASMIEKHLDVLRTVQGRVAQLKKQGQSAEDTAKTLSAELETRFPEWASRNRIAPVARAFHAELP
jgi:glyoxylase-like metal-dependent hydrolase (beta-lactamase superfamily II)